MSLPLPDSFSALLTEAECAQIDQTLLPTRDRFSIRLKVYALRYLTQVAQRLDISIRDLAPEQIMAQLKLDPNLTRDGGFDESFADWFGNLLVSSLKPLEIMAQNLEISIEDLSLEQIIAFQQQQVDAANL